MRLIRSIVVIGLLAALILPAGPAAHATREKGLEDYLQDSFDNSNVPGMAVAVTRDDDVVFSGGFGVDGRGEPMTAQTPLRAASLTKSVTSVAVHQLADKDLVDLDDPVVEHLPELELDDARYEDMTIQQLLDNRSGMRDDQFDLTRLNDSESLEDYVAGLDGAALATGPGEVEAYCNVNWEVLARMVEVVAVQPYEEYLEDEVFDPLGMTASTVDPDAVNVPGGYQEIFGFHVPRGDDVLFSASSGSNGLITTADDLGRWARWVASGESDDDVLEPATRERIIDRAVGEEGADGFELREERIGKGGMHHTEMSQLLTEPANGHGVAVAVNSSDMAGLAYPVASGALDLMAGDRPEPAGSGWWLPTAGYGVMTLLSLVAGIVGMRRAKRWAAHRAEGRHRWATFLRLLWLPTPALVLVALPTIVHFLTKGTRTASWDQLSYLFLSPLVVLVVMAAAGLGVLTARTVALRSHGRDVGPSPQ